MTEITTAQFTSSLSGWMPSAAPYIARAFAINGGGNIESWLLTQYILSFPAEDATLDYWREYAMPIWGTESSYYIDLAFNVQAWNANCPPILSEWKCKPVQNELVVGFNRDIGKLCALLKPYENAQVKPYPILVGVSGYMSASNLPFGFSATPLGSGLGLFLSSPATWNAYGLMDCTAYSTAQSIPEQAVMAGAPA